MDKHALNAQRICDQTRMLTARTPETVQRIPGHIIAALNANFFDRVGHIFNCNAQETFRKLLDRFFNTNLMG